MNVKKIISTVLFFIFCMLCLKLTFAAGIDKIVATVGKEVITQSEADAYLNVILLQLSQEFSGKELEEKTTEAKRDFLSRMIEDKVILSQAKKQGIQARQDKLKYKIEEMKEGFPSEIAFTMAFKQKGLTIKDLENRMADQIIMREVVEREVKDKIVVSPDEVTAFYEEHKNEFLQPEQYLVESLYVVDESTLEKLTTALKESSNFKAQADKFGVAYSNEQIAKFEGTKPEIREALDTIKPDEISAPLKIGNGYYIFKLKEITAAKTQSLIEAHNHINSYLFQEKFAQKMTDWLEDLKAKIYIEIKK